MKRRNFILTPLAIALVGKSVVIDKIIKNTVWGEAFLGHTDMGTMSEAINRITLDVSVHQYINMWRYSEKRGVLTRSKESDLSSK